MISTGLLCYNKSIMEILDKLNEEQIKPVLQTEGAVLVLAGAGSGKTRVLTSRIAYILAEGKAPSSAVLAITFTNKAADEMKERIEKIADADNMWICTIHSMCVRILRMYPAEAGVEKNFSIYSEQERSALIKKAYSELGYDNEELLKKAKYHISNAKMLGLTPEEYLFEAQGEYGIENCVKIYQKYERYLRQNNALDFDDLLSRTRLLLRDFPEIKEYLGGRFKYILVDEFQDTNGVQYEIIKHLASGHGNLFAVGDDDQSIYGWRGAKIENILNFERDFPGAKVFKLEQNYRSTQNILDVANQVIVKNHGRHDKTLWTNNPVGEKVKAFETEDSMGEARKTAYVIEELVRRGYSYSDFAVLMRINALTRAYEQEFMSDGIPFKVFGGFKFYERKEIKDVLAYLRLIANPFDGEALTRIVNVPKRGIGAKTVAVLEDYAEENGLSVYDALLETEKLDLNAGAKEKLIAFREVIKGFIYLSYEQPVDKLVKSVISDTGLKDSYDETSEDGYSALANINEFVNSVEEYSKLNPTAELEDYLSEIMLYSDTEEMDDGNYVTVATIHAVKGLEFRCVFLCGLEENVMPISRAYESSDKNEMEEERRLMYVAVTRARELLYLSRAKNRFLYGSTKPTARSVFLKELADKVGLKNESEGRSLFASDGYDDYGYYRRKDEFYGSKTYGAKQYGERTRSVQKDDGFSFGHVDAGQGSFVFGGAKPKQSPTPQKDLSVFTIGTKVVHAKFGAGVVVGIKGTGANMILDIAFTGGGIKQLSASLAPLTVQK